MGVIGLELKWDVVEDSQVKTLNQIFYLDAEEFGLESLYGSIWRQSAPHCGREGV